MTTVAALYRRLMCWLGYHRYRVLRVLKPHLYIEHGWRIGCDLECTRCGLTLWWREMERDAWQSPFGRETERHPNEYCPCGVCTQPPAARRDIGA